MQNVQQHRHALVEATDHRPCRSLSVVGIEQLPDIPAWSEAFAADRKDHRFYEIVEKTVWPKVHHGYFVARDNDQEPVAVQPYFVVDVDLLEGAARPIRSIADLIRRYWPQFMRLRALMVGCLAGEGHLANRRSDKELVQQLANHLPEEARRQNAPLIVWKEFPARYREVMNDLLANGYVRIPSLPMTCLNIDYNDFEDYVTRALSRVTRKSLRRRLRKAERSGPIELTIHTDVSHIVTELYPLYEQVYDRSPQHFEKLTPAFICSLGKEMSDRARFFVWRLRGRVVAFSICLVHGDSVWDEYLGLEYPLALELHLYHYTFRDIVSWGIRNGYRFYRSSGLNYDPKLHWRSRLDPLDLYVRHRRPVLNILFRSILPILEPVRRAPVLKKFENYDELFG